ncbi:MAG: hypothetical protein ACPGED_12270 [Flavobacteriales bacterium]
MANDKTISFSGEELLRMRAFYEQEYITTKNKLNELAGMLNKLGTTVSIHENMAPINAPVQTAAKLSTSAPAAKKSEDDGQKRKRKKKRGPKPTWSKFILDQLKEADKPMTYSELIRNAMVLKHKAESERGKVKASILNSAFRLRARELKIATKGEAGKKAVYLVLTKWQDENGDLISPYNHKYEEMLLRAED